MSQQGQGYGQSQRSAEGGGSSDGPFFRGQLEAVMSACSKLSFASRKEKNRQFRIWEIKRLLMQYRSAVYVLELALADELEGEKKEQEESGDAVPSLPVRLRTVGGPLTPDTVTVGESEIDFGDTE